MSNTKIKFQKKGNNQPIEPYLQKMYSKIRDFSEVEWNFELMDSKLKIESRLVIIRRILNESGASELEDIAQEISHDALKIGATKLLDEAIKMQGAARGGIGDLAKAILEDMEDELSNINNYIQATGQIK